MLLISALVAALSAARQPACYPLDLAVGRGGRAVYLGPSAESAARLSATVRETRLPSLPFRTSGLQSLRSSRTKRRTTAGRGDPTACRSADRPARTGPPPKVRPRRCFAGRSMRPPGPSSRRTRTPPFRQTGLRPACRSGTGPERAIALRPVGIPRATKRRGSSR
jgi:hypothetical protein